MLISKQSLDINTTNHNDQFGKIVWKMGMRDLR